MRQSSIAALLTELVTPTAQAYVVAQHYQCKPARMHGMVGGNMLVHAMLSLHTVLAADTLAQLTAAYKSTAKHMHHPLRQRQEPLFAV